MSRLPTGTVTFLFTDIEGSTRLLQALGDRFRAVIERHNDLLRSSIEAHSGVVVRTEGDAFFAVFERAADAVAAAVEAQRSLHTEPWPDGRPIGVRMGLHTGEGTPGGDDYVGFDVHRAARIGAAAHGGQVLVSASTRALADGAQPEGVRFRALGPHRLKDLPRAEDLSQVEIEGLPISFPPLRARQRDRLPTYRTSFLGREEELERLGSLLQPGRLVTLTGAGGTGKTRLAVECARAAVERFPDGAFFVDLATVEDPDRVPAAIAAAIGIPEEPGRPALEAIREHLEGRSALLVLDNFEQVVEAAPVLTALADATPASAFLATSRIPLQISGEQRFPMMGLAEAAAALFVDRARGVDPLFDPSPDELEEIRAICVRLDGLPLAVELAASRIADMPVGELRAHVTDRLAEVGQGPRDAPARQRSLESLISWSYDLLSEEERLVFEGLGVFVGSWPADAPQPVIDPEGTLDVGSALRSLTLNNLIRRPDRTSTRMSMLTTIRDFAETRARYRGQPAALRARHAAFFADLAETAGPHIIGPEQPLWRSKLDAERDNLLAAVTWSLSQDPSIGLRIIAASWRHWQQRGEMASVRGALRRLLDTEVGRRRTLLRARALSALGSLAYYQADLDEVARAYPEALEIFQGVGDEAGVAEATWNLTYLSLSTGDLAGAEPLARDAVARFAALGDVRGEASARVALAAVLLGQGDLEAARAEASRSVRELDEAGDWIQGNYARDLVARVDMEAGDVDAAFEGYLALLDHARALGNDMGMVIGMAIMAKILSARGDHRRAVLLAGVHETQRSVLGLSLPEPITYFEDPRPAAEAVLGPGEVASLWSQGQGMSMLEAFELIDELRP